MRDKINTRKDRDEYAWRAHTHNKSIQTNGTGMEVAHLDTIKQQNTRSRYAVDLVFAVSSNSFIYRERFTHRTWIYLLLLLLFAF